MEKRTDRFTALEEKFAGYEVYDPHGEKIGKVDDLFIDENDQPEYIGVKMGFLGTRSTLIPWEIARAREGERRIEVSVEKARAKEGPSFDDDREITPEYENEVRSYYGLQGVQGSEQRGAYGEETDLLSGERHPGLAMGDHKGGEFREHAPEAEGLTEPEDDLEDKDELRVQRTEEELRAGTREREAGAMRVRKRVRTDREQLRVPKRREEVHVERVPVEGREASEVEIGDDEVVMPVTEEEVVVEKRPEVKEEIRVRKDVVKDEEVVEEDVRREEVDIDDQTERGSRLGEDVGHGADLDEETRRRGR
jgi:uncharacterized protein (TIGR02271 family)